MSDNISTPGMGAMGIVRALTGAGPMSTMGSGKNKKKKKKSTRRKDGRRKKIR